MKTVYLVDDDFISRSRVRGLIDWESEGYRITGEAESGREALELFERNTPDILLLDMDLPDISGLEVIGQLQSAGMQSSIVVLSAYDDYRFVRESLKNGAAEYLLKNALTPGQLLEALRHAERKQQEDSIRTTTYILPERLRRFMMGSEENSGEIESQLNKYGLSSPYSLVLAEIDNYHLMCAALPGNGGNRLSNAFFEIISKSTREKAGMTAVYAGEKAVVLLSGQACTGQDRLTEHIRELSESIHRLLNINASFCIGKTFYDFTELPVQYQTLAAAMADRLYHGNYVFTDGMLSEKENREPLSFLFTPEVERDITRLLESGDISALDALIKGSYSSMAASKETRNNILRSGCQIISTVCTLCKQRRIGIADVFGEEEPYNHFCLLETVPDMCRYTLDACHRFVNVTLSVKETELYSPATVQAIGFIRRNYMEDISLDRVATGIGNNSSYLSRVFKKDTGVNFTEYLNRFRVQRARELIQVYPERPVKQIAEEVGYMNYNHFFAAFKKETGVSPLSYQKEEK